MLDLGLRRTVFAIATLAASFTALHCSSSRDSFSPEPKDAQAPPAPFVDGASADGYAVEPLPDCPDENKQIYIVTAELHGDGDRRLYRFDPQTLVFSDIGRLGCPTSADTFSMAVDRRGTAWVEYTDGRIFKVSTKDASCEATAFRPGQHGLEAFGMGFAKDDNEAGAPLSETLYLAGSVLARLDLSTFEVSPVGSVGPGVSELTGTGAGALYLLTTAGTRLVRLDKTTGTVLETFRPDIPPMFALAFAHWGGDFWLFTNTEMGGYSRVTRYSPSTNTAKVMIADTRMAIIGAGSSTCAPVEPPH